MMIGRCRPSGRPRRMRQTSRPLNTGRLRSRIIRSGGAAATALSASSPVPTMCASASPVRSRVCLIRPAMSCSSSTMRTRCLGIRNERHGGGHGSVCRPTLSGSALGEAITSRMPGAAVATVRDLRRGALQADSIRWTFRFRIEGVKCGLHQARSRVILPESVRPRIRLVDRPLSGCWGSRRVRVVRPDAGIALPLHVEQAAEHPGRELAVVPGTGDRPLRRARLRSRRQRRRTVRGPSRTAP